MGMQESLLTKAARDLSQQEALDLFLYLVEQGEISLVDRVRTNDAGAVTSLRPGAQVQIRTTISGVDFFKARGNNHGLNGSAGAAQVASFSPTPAFAIVLSRLANFLASEWKITRIVYGGIGLGGGLHATDCHMTGHCVDFYGGRIDTGQDFDVRRDWWSRTVYRKDNGKAHTSNGFDRWSDDTNTYFRLAISNDAEDQKPAQFFADVYEFVTEQCTLGPDIGDDAFRHGDPLRAGTVMHPDYPVAGIPGVVAGRRGHNDHMHFQLGKAYE
ncbi:MAG TPA: hypothetical protein VMH81_11330 [Bryobacteraceae bacterium]|nr:hypothetical protein [Bryobacteraceae bacterium]